MKVAIVHDWLNGMRGGEKVLEILCEIFPEAPIYTLLCESDKISPAIMKNRRIHTTWVQRWALTRARYRQLLPILPKIFENFDLREYDLVISNSHCVAKGVRVRADATHISFCHTPMRYVWDMKEEYFGSWGYVSRALIEPVLAALRDWDERTSQGVDHFIANSRFVAERIKRLYRRDAEVIYPPVDTIHYRPGNKQKVQKGEYFLIVSALVPYKKVDLAVEAFRGRKENLVVIGSGPMHDSLVRQAPNNVHILGWIDQERLLEYYQGCRAFLFPQKEDFGITPLEAHACGKPVIAFGRGGAVESVIGHPAGHLPPGTEFPGGEPTGLFFAEQTPESLRWALDTFLKVEGSFKPYPIRRHALAFDRDLCRNTLRNFILAKVPAMGETVPANV